MRYLLIQLVFTYCFIFTANAHTVVDDIGNTLHWDKSAHRIISLAPDITEILFAIGAGAKIKGVIKGSDFPLEANHLPVVGAYNGLDLEKILALKPDLIIVWDNTFIRQLAVFKQLGIPIYTSKPVQISDVAHSMQQLGKLTGNELQANTLADVFRTQVNTLQQKYQHKKRLRVYYQIGDYALLTINHKSWINQAIDLCGGENVFAHVKTITAEITWESLLEKNPQVIITDSMADKLKHRLRLLSQIDAMKNQQLYSIPADLIDRAGPRLIQGVTQICASIDAARRSYAAKI